MGTPSQSKRYASPTHQPTHPVPTCVRNATLEYPGGPGAILLSRLMPVQLLRCSSATAHISPDVASAANFLPPSSYICACACVCACVCACACGCVHTRGAPNNPRSFVSLAQQTSRSHQAAQLSIMLQISSTTSSGAVEGEVLQSLPTCIVPSNTSVAGSSHSSAMGTIYIFLPFFLLNASSAGGGYGQGYQSSVISHRHNS